MKIRIISLITVLCLLLSTALVACTGNVNENTTTDTKPENTTEAQDNTTESKADTEETESETDTETVAPAYKVTVVDENGNAVAGAEVQLCIVGGMCLMPAITDANGTVSIEAAAAEYQATVRIGGVVVAEYVPFPAGSMELTVTVTLGGDESDSTESDSNTEETGSEETDSAETETAETETN